MSAQLIDGLAVAAAVRARVAAEVAAIADAGGRPPGLATIVVGDDPGSAVYVANKHKACAEIGVAGFHHDLEANSSREDVAAVISALNENDEVDGILLQRPVPSHLDGGALSALVAPAKDVDGLTPTSAGMLALGRPGLRPCTPAGVIELLKHYGVALEGAKVVIVGRSDLVGKPLAALCLQENATVTVCHSRSRDLGEICRSADVLVAAVGRPRLVEGEWVKHGATVIDVGISRVEGKLVGDVNFEAASERAALITPVPGGVGPMTIAMLLSNTLDARRAAE